MSESFSHVRLLTLPVSISPAAGLLDALHLEMHGTRIDLLVDYHELRLSARPELFERDGQPWERVQGEYIPRRLRFVDAFLVKEEGIMTCLEGLPQDDPGRLLNTVWAWRGTDGVNNYIFDLRRKDHDSLWLTATGCLAEPRQGPAWETSLERDWSPTPLPPSRPIPNPRQLHQRFGGDPVTVRLAGGWQARRLFIGGLDTQTDQRPDVSAVLNLSEDASLWVSNAQIHPADRWVRKGEGSKGMTVRDLAEEADWVIARLNRGERVLVHCSAGTNRSASVCCAALIRLEKLTAEAALARVRERHPWAKPDPHHWLALRWMAS